MAKNYYFFTCKKVVFTSCIIAIKNEKKLQQICNYFQLNKVFRNIIRINHPC